ncbi:unnamed protein product [Mycena citricolor]|uniref:Amino acid transporter n=1 Tax=Mycena citricolor TaxID=2018698 RepID=A0AAD2HEH0_9AGAR|nr:unnamed protein product [Mycena citricolor]
MKFDELGLHEGIMEGIETMNFKEMTPVQEQTIPIILEGKDLIACAQTGTGKTAAYTLPLLDRLLHEGNPDNVVKSLIVVPTRELAQQIDIQFQGFSYFLPLSTTVVYGGGDGIGWSQQKQGMIMGSDIVIATPGRLLAHIQNSGVDLSHIVAELPAQRQTVMFSATLPPKIRQLAKQILRDPSEVNIAISKPNEAISQVAYVCYENQKIGIIRELFARPSGTKTIIFSSSKLKTKELARTLKQMKLNVGAMHSDLEQEQREAVMLDFRNGKIDILVATDIVARGIDIEDIDYIHRIGRTARASATGTGITFVSEQEQDKFQRIEKFIEREIEKLPIPERLGKGPKYDPAACDRRGSRRNFHGRGRVKGAEVPTEEFRSHYEQAVEQRRADAQEVKSSGPLQFVVDVIPENVVQAAGDNTAMLQLILLSIVFGVAMVAVGKEKSAPVKNLIESLNGLF